jgi:oligopeptide transport system substrate-binding protein
MKSSIYMLFTALFLLAGLAGCSTSTPLPPTAAPSDTATREPSSTPTQTPSPTPTYTPSPSPAPTETPTRTPTPTLTPTPRGYYANDPGGYSFILSSDWENLDEDGAYAFFGNRKMGLFFEAWTAIYEDEVESFAEWVEYLADPENGYFKQAEIESIGEITLGDGTPAQQANIVGIDSSDLEATWRVIQVSQGPKEYYFFFTALTADFQAGRSTVQRVIDSIVIGSPTLFGLDRAQTLVMLGYDPDPEDIDPALVSGSAAGYSGLLFSGLVRLSPNLEADLAESWTISPDGKVYTFVLRPDAAFSSGRPITAEDVVYSWTRAADPKTRSTTATTYLGDILGVSEVFAGEAKEIRGLRVIDERTLEVTLDEAKPYFLAKLSYPTAFIVDKADIERKMKNWVYSPNASGPFVLREVIDGEALVFERNEAYHAPAKVQGIVYLLYRGGTMSSFFNAGEIDFAYLGPTEAMQVLEPDHPNHDRLRTSTNMCTSMVMFNNTRAPLDDPAVRQALSLAVDKERLVELLSENMSIRADSILPPGMPGYAEELVRQVYDAEQALAVLASSRYAGELPVLKVAVGGYEEGDLERALGDMWREALGVQIELEYLEWNEFMKSARETDKHILLFGWCADYPDPENFLDILFHSESDFNPSNYANPEVDALLVQARTELDPGARLQLYQQIDRMLLEDFAAVPYIHSVSYILISDRVEGYRDAPIGIKQWDRVSIRQE